MKDLIENISQQIIIISGATATGKTKISIEISELIKSNIKKNPVIINFDSLCFYKELFIGTARPSTEEMRDIHHYLVGSESAKNHLNAKDFCDKALQILNKLRQDDIPIFVGGSAFYIRALIKGMYEADSNCEENSKVKNEIKILYEKEGINKIISELKECDPDSLAQIHANDHYRLMRALEFFKQSGKKISKIKNDSKNSNPYDFSINRFPKSKILHIYLDLPKEQHLNIIENRCQQMKEQGLINEVKNLLKNGFDGTEKAMQSIGYKEVVSYLNNQIETEEKCFERIFISTRQLAKSQKTFFKKISPKEVFNPITQLNEIHNIVINFLTS